MRIKSIKKIKNDSKLYDIMVEKTKCFFANNILVHNSSTSFFIWENEFGVASRNMNLKETDTNSFWKAARDLNIESKMRKYMKDHNMKALTLQGELVGEGVQSNRLKLKGRTVYFFRAFDPIKYQFIPYLDFIDMINEMGLTTVPIISTNYKLPDSYKDLIEHADGKSKLSDSPREGIVFVSLTSSNNNGRDSFKAISNKYILKHNL